MSEIFDQLQALQDKVNSPALQAFLQQFGEDKYAGAEVFNLFRDALIELYNGGSGFEQNNITLWRSTFWMDSDEPTEASVTAYINQYYTFSVSPIHSRVYFRFFKYDGPNTTWTYVFDFGGGVGTWGTNDYDPPGTVSPVQQSRIKFISKFQTTVGDIQEDDLTEIIELNDIFNESYFLANANGEERDLSNLDKGYYFSYYALGVLYLARFVGEPGIYGSGTENALLETDFAHITNSSISPDYATISDLLTKLNIGSNEDFEKLGDASDVMSVFLATRTGAVFRSENVEWNESEKKFTIKGSQAIWKAYADVTDGNMGIEVLAGAVEAFKLFDAPGNFFSVGTESGKRLARIFAALRLVNGPSQNETEFKHVNCPGSVTTLLKGIAVPENSILTVDVLNIAIMNTDKNYIIGRAQFSFKNDGGTVTDVSLNAFRYDGQFTTIPLTDGYVTNIDTRIDAAVSGTNANINFVNTVNRETNVQCEIKFTVTLMPT